MMKRYDVQKCANQMSLFSGGKLDSMAEILTELVPALEARGIRWAASMSLALFLNGAHDVFHDFDLLIDPNDTAAFEEVFEALGGEINHETKQKSAFTSPYYKEAILKGIHFDLIADITIETYGTVYRYSLEDVEYITLRHNINVPVIPMEAQFVLYYLMIAWDKRRLFKAEACEGYLRQEGLRHPNILRKALKGTEMYSKKYGRNGKWQLPEDLKKVIAELLEEYDEKN